MLNVFVSVSSVLPAATQAKRFRTVALLVGYRASRWTNATITFHHSQGLSTEEGLRTVCCNVHLMSIMEFSHTLSHSPRPRLATHSWVKKYVLIFSFVLIHSHSLLPSLTHFYAFYSFNPFCSVPFRSIHLFVCTFTRFVLLTVTISSKQFYVFSLCSQSCFAHYGICNTATAEWWMSRGLHSPLWSTRYIATMASQ